MTSETKPRRSEEVWLDLGDIAIIDFRNGGRGTVHAGWNLWNWKYIRDGIVVNFGTTATKEEAKRQGEVAASRDQ